MTQDPSGANNFQQVTWAHDGSWSPVLVTIQEGLWPLRLRSSIFLKLGWGTSQISSPRSVFNYKKKQSHNICRKKWMQLETMMPSETSWTQEEETCIFSHMWTMDRVCVSQRWEEENLRERWRSGNRIYVSWKQRRGLCVGRKSQQGQRGDGEGNGWGLWIRAEYNDISLQLSWPNIALCAN